MADPKFKVGDKVRIDRIGVENHGPFKNGSTEFVDEVLAETLSDGHIRVTYRFDEHWLPEAWLIKADAQHALDKPGLEGLMASVTELTVHVVALLKWSGTIFQGLTSLYDLHDANKARIDALETKIGALEAKLSAQARAPDTRELNTAGALL